jgi:hypothetical protein
VATDESTASGRVLCINRSRISGRSFIVLPAKTRGLGTEYTVADN